MSAPVQIILNPDNFVTDRDAAGGGGPRKDFFLDRDREFQQHRERVALELEAAAAEIDRQAPQLGAIGVIKVFLRRPAWAKSHRPTGQIFKKALCELVGGLDLGEMLFEVRPEALRKFAREVRVAEDAIEWRLNKKTSKLEPWPTALRSEVGAIEKIELYGPADRRRFSLDQAIAWLSNPITGGSYQVELFEEPPPMVQWDALSIEYRRLYQTFLSGLQNLGMGMTTHRIRGDRSQKSSRLAVRVEETVSPASVQLTTGTATRGRPVVPFSADRDRHIRVLGFLEKHPLVREILLPGILERSDATSRSRPTTATLPVRDASAAWPKMGVIDGGVSDIVGDWIIGRWGVLDPSHINASHGTFIAGLAIAGGSLNGPQVCRDRDGVEIYDVPVLPGTDAAYASYYPSGLEDFLVEVENAVAEARNRHGVRVFNFSLNVQAPVQSDHYSFAAKRLDEIAERHDVLIFISAGNLRASRAEWTDNDNSMLAMLATTTDDGLHQPAESVRNATVGAINPPGMAGIVNLAPARYTRRGPGMKALIKPDFAHIGGCGSPHPHVGNGLYSIDPVGAVADGCGTSYATPLVAKTAAALDASIEGPVSRETLLALLTHHAQTPECLTGKSLAPVARHLVGHGVPPDAATILAGGDNQITLVFAARLMPGKQLVFPFSWPASLVTAEGKCAGDVRLTLVSTPPVDERFGAELLRVNIDAALQQDSLKGWRGQLKPAFLPESYGEYTIEAERIEHGAKWNPVKVWERSTKGIGKSSNWRLTVDYLTRLDEVLPREGVPFTAILTIADSSGEKPIFNEMRQSLQTLGVQVSDIRTAARVSARV